MASATTEFWACSQCTFHNNPALPMCEMCNAKKTSPSNNQSSNDENHNAVASALNGIGHTVNGLFDKVASRFSNSHSSSPATGPSSSTRSRQQNNDVWTCPRCTFSQNPVWARLCDACAYDPAQIYEEQVHVVPATPRPPPAARPVALATTNANSAKNTVEDPSPVISPNSFLIEDHEAQLHKALNEWQSIVAKLSKANRQFSDSGFKPCLDSILYDPSQPLSKSELFDTGQSGASNIDANRICWKRPYEATNLATVTWGWLFDQVDRRSSSTWTVFRSPMPSDIHQGVLGNCWLVSALSLIACEPLLLHKIFITPDFQPTGAYALRLCIDGRWRVIIVDDILPCYGTRNSQLLFTKATRNQLWIPLIEKAMAKAFGCYEALAGGHTYEGLSALTGEAVETFVLPEDEQNDSRAGKKRETISPEELWIKLVSYLEARFLIGVSCGRESGSEALYNSVGLIKHHAYAVLAVHSSINPNSGQPLRLVKLRNPWGTSDWRGDWCDASPTWKKDCPVEVKNQLAPYGQSEGVFWMSFRDFLCYFESVDVCKVRPDWHEYRITAAFLRPPSESSVVTLLTVVETSQVELMLHQHGLRQKSKVNRSPVDLFLVVCSVRRVQSMVVVERVVGTSGSRRLDAFSQAGEFMLQPGEYAVVALSCHAACSPDCDNRAYTLSVHSAKALVADPIAVPRSFTVDALTQYVRTSGKKYYGPGDVVVSYVTERFMGLALLVDNGNAACQVRVECNCEGSENVVSTRGVLKSVDHLPPNSSQLVQVLTPLEPRERWHVVHHLKYATTSVQPQQQMGVFGRALFSRQSNTATAASQTLLPQSEPPIADDLRWLHGNRPLLR